MNVAVSFLAELPESALVNLATAVEAGWLAGDSPNSAFSSLAGGHSADVARWLVELERESFSPAQVGRLLRSVAAGRLRDRLLLPDLVVSGPDVPGVPSADTYAVVQSLFQEAQEEIVLAGYAFHNGRQLFERLAEQKTRHPQLRIIFHVDVPRRSGDTSTADSVILRYAQDFRQDHWPWQPVPEIYFDPRALETESHSRACLHAKIVVVDRQRLFLTSANFTGAAHQKSIELGLLCAVPHLAERVCSYFAGLRQAGLLRRLPDV